jgi:hypothetical protein
LATEDIDRWKLNEKMLSEREALPEELRDEYMRLVEAYRYHAFLIHSQPFVSYRVLAALIRDGWRHGNG